jgi:hypothetical protein
MDGGTTGWMTGHRTRAVNRADRLVTSFRAASDRDATGSEKRNGVSIRRMQVDSPSCSGVRFPGPRHQFGEPIGRIAFDPALEKSLAAGVRVDVVEPARCNERTARGPTRAAAGGSIAAGPTGAGHALILALVPTRTRGVAGRWAASDPAGPGSAARRGTGGPACASGAGPDANGTSACLNSCLSLGANRPRGGTR